MLITANSGSGKSWAIRKLIEECYGHVQIIVLDIEGEFNTLREKFDFVLVGKEGDIQTNIKSADLLAKKLLELNVSSIIDLYELKQHERRLFVKRFLESMVNAPKELWHDCIVVIDESHLFAPEKGKSEASSAVIDLMTRGRKRGFAGILCTQRLSKLSKDAGAEANNVLIGRSTLDIDMKRASETLGFTSKSQMRSLRELEPGEFYAFGPALSKGVNKVTIGEVVTSHPTVGSKATKLKIPPRGKIKSILGKLSDLPQEAETELRDKADYRNKIRELQNEIRSLKMSKPKASVVDRSEILKVEKMYREEMRKLHGNIEELQKNARWYETTINKMRSILDIKHDIKPVKTKIMVLPDKTPLPEDFKIREPLTVFTDKSKPVDDDDNGHRKLSKCERSVLGFLVSNSDRTFSKTQISIMTGYSVNSGSFSNSLSYLNARGYIKRDGDKIRSSGTSPIEYDNTSLEYNINNIKGILGKCELEILEIVLANPETIYSKEEIAEMTPSQYISSSGSFSNSISRLASLGLITRQRGGSMSLSEDAKEML